MTRIGSVGSISSDQLRALHRIAQLGKAISVNQQRLTTLRRINSAQDDPAGLVQATLLEQELASVETASKSISRASAMLNTADAAAGEIVEQLQTARTLALAAAGGDLSATEVAANQVELDGIIASVDRLAATTFGGKALLNGAAGYVVAGVDTGKVNEVSVTDKQGGNTVTVSMNVTSVATRATDTYSDGALTEDVTLTVTGQKGSTAISIADGATLQQIADAFNAVQHETGVVATVDSGDVLFTSAEYGSKATISIEATEGTFDLDTGGTISGTDVVATVNGATVTGDGATLAVHSGGVSLVVELNPTASGAIDPISISDGGLRFQTGSSPSSGAQIGLPSLLSTRLGGSAGRLSSVVSGRGNSLVEGKAYEAVRIIDAALADATRSRALIGGFQQSTLDSSERVLAAQAEHLSEALSAVRDTDVALESVQLSNNRLLQETALQALSIVSQRSDDVLSLLRSVAGR